MEHQSQSDYVMQMDRIVNEGEISIHFREIRLPRPVRIEYPRPSRFLMDQWKMRTQILVAAIADAPVGYKITLFTEKYKSFFEKSSFVRAKNAILSQRTKMGEMHLAK